ncbi:MAG: cytidylyltransferase domain-containing protein [Methylophagaceae bacterium]
MKSTAILIPARYNSTRFPGKPLAMLDGVPMIKRVYDACIASKIPTYVLTDDQRIFNLFGDGTCWIDQEHEYKNGTERCAGAITDDNFTKYFGQYDQFINVQGDMPDVTVEMIERCVEWLKYYSISTVFTNLTQGMKNDPNTVKMIRAGDQALWFGRGITGYGEWHLGIYGYRRDALNLYPSLEITQEETIEQLEQLRWLKNGWQIGCSSVYYKGVEINAPEDVDVWHKINSQ